MRKKGGWLFFLYAGLLFGITFINIAQEREKPTKLFKDTLDGAFDISHYLLKLHGLLPIPTITLGDLDRHHPPALAPADSVQRGGPARRHVRSGLVQR